MPHPDAGMQVPVQIYWQHESILTVLTNQGDGHRDVKTAKAGNERVESTAITCRIVASLLWKASGWAIAPRRAMATRRPVISPSVVALPSGTPSPLPTASKQAAQQAPFALFGRLTSRRVPFRCASRSSWWISLTLPETHQSQVRGAVQPPSFSKVAACSRPQTPKASQSLVPPAKRLP